MGWMRGAGDRRTEPAEEQEIALHGPGLLVPRLDSGGVSGVGDWHGDCSNRSHGRIVSRNATHGTLGAQRGTTHRPARTKKAAPGVQYRRDFAATVHRLPWEREGRMRAGTS